ncbi:type II toxin-antitoxin system Phd/YefM family antitoxin [Kitasatospora cinereorecta]|uniref:Type II toxin-antitoxin system Phd/YefM family antitoxin n=1 Tax=Kitasatospora cinereorecta TaxID=285560 RepID=A0ABW0VMW2_9ACTN
MPTVALADARAELSKIVTLAEHTGRITAITRYGKPVAAVVPAALLHLLSGASIGPQPIQASEMERIAARALSASRRPTSDEISEALEDVRADASELPPTDGPTSASDASMDHFLIEALRGGRMPVVARVPADNSSETAADLRLDFLIAHGSPSSAEDFKQQLGRTSVRNVLAHDGSVPAEHLAALPEDLTMADLLEAWAEKQRGGAQ